MPTPAEMKAKKLKQKQATLLSTSRDMATVRMAASMHVSETQNRRLARGHYSSLPLAHLTGDLLADSPGISPEASGRRKSSKEGLDQLMQVRHRELSSPVCRTFDHDSTVAPFCQPLHREWKNQPLAISMLHPLVQKFLRFACAIPHVALARAHGRRCYCSSLLSYGLVRRAGSRAPLQHPLPQALSRRLVFVVMLAT